jgi:hypothetical protein
VDDTLNMLSFVNEYRVPIVLLLSNASSLITDADLMASIQRSDWAVAEIGLGIHSRLRRYCV